MSQHVDPWPIAASEIQDIVGQPFVIDSVRNYLWIVIFGGVLMFGMAWGIGANDVANAFATSVGAKSLTLRQACVIAVFMEFLGAFLLGKDVADTVRKKIINPNVFDPLQEDGAANGPELLMIGFMCALLTATVWLLVATYFALPVSTTHSIIGALIGIAMVYRGPAAVVWIPEGSSGFDSLTGVVGVVVSWFVSPILSGLFAVALFIIIRTTVLTAGNPVKRALIFMPFFFAFAIMIVLFFIIYKGSPRLGLDKRFSVGHAIAVSVGSGAFFGLLSWFTAVPLAKRHADRWEATEIERQRNPDAICKTDDRVTSALARVGFHLDLNEELSDDIIIMHDNVAKFDPKAERLFAWLQIFTAAFDAFGHGANDVANAVAPFTSIYQVYQNNGGLSKVKTSEFGFSGTYTGGSRDGDSFEEGDNVPNGESSCGMVGDDPYFACEIRFPNTQAGASGAKSAELSIYEVDEDTEMIKFVKNQTCYTKCAIGNAASYEPSQQSIELWILAVGGLGIVLGLAMWGYRIINAIGVRLTKLTPSRGFSIELGAAITVILAARLGFPVSTTHCQVGATMGVGLVQLKSNTVNWKQFLFICIGWICTVILTGLFSALCFFIVTHSPTTYDAEADNVGVCGGENLFVYDGSDAVFRGIRCSGNL